MKIKGNYYHLLYHNDKYLYKILKYNKDLRYFYLIYIDLILDY